MVTMGLAGCATPGEKRAREGPIAFETVERGQDSGIEERDTQVVRNRSALDQLWNRHAPGESVPDVNFDDRMVAAVFKGESSNGCHGSEITNVTGLSDGRVRVEGEHYRIDAEACTEQITYPYHVIELPRFTTEVSFAMEGTVREGPSREDGSGGESPGDEGSDDGEDTSGPEPLTFHTLDKGRYSDIQQERTVVIRKTSAWRSLWNEHTNASENPRPSVGFEDAIVVGVFRGESADGCQRARVNEVVRDKGLTVRGEHHSVASKQESCTQEITYPYHIAQVNATDRPVTFDVAEASQPEEGPDGQGSYTCRSQGSVDPADADGPEVSTETVDEGGQSGIEETCLTVVRNRTAWQDLWAAHQSNSDTDDQRPEVNFSMSILVAAFKGESSDTCHDARVDSVRETGSRLVAHVVFSAEGTYCGEAITYPYHIAKVSSRASVDFALEDRTT